MAERAEPPVHRVEELWAIRCSETNRLAGIDHSGDVYFMTSHGWTGAYASRRAAEDALDDEFGRDWHPSLEVVRIVTGGADGR